MQMSGLMLTIIHIKLPRMQLNYIVKPKKYFCFINLHEYVAASFSPGMLTFSIRDNTIVSFRVNIAWWGMPVGG